MFQRYDKSLSKYHFFNYVYENINSHKNSQSTDNRTNLNQLKRCAKFLGSSIGGKKLISSPDCPQYPLLSSLPNINRRYKPADLIESLCLSFQ